MRCVLFFLSFSFGVAFAQEKSIQPLLHVETGLGLLKNDLEHGGYGSLTNVLTSVFALGLGIETEHGLSLEAAYYMQREALLFSEEESRVSFNQAQFILSYPFHLGRLAITPKVGYSFWRLEDKDGDFLGLERGSEMVVEGKDPFFSINLLYPAKKIVSFSTTYHYMETRFGGSRGLSLGIVVRP